ncbi:MAG: DUF2058 family protein [Pseudomonadota bacterium]
MGSLQDALLQSGLTSEDQLEQARKRKPTSSKPRRTGTSGVSKRTSSSKPAGAKHSHPGPKRKPRSDLEKAWQARRKAERDEKEQAKQARVADQEARRQRNLKLDQLVEGKVLNLDDANTPRYFEHLGRIRRVMCSTEQRTQLNNGALGLVNLRGRYLIVDRTVLEAYRALADDLVPDLSAEEPDAESEGDDYPPVPDDMVW